MEMIKRERGRPIITDEKKKDKNVKVRLDQELFDQLYYISKVTGMSTSDILRKGLSKMFKDVVSNRE